MKFKVAGYMTVSCWIEVEADSPEEAKRRAASMEPAEHSIDGSYPVDECWHFSNDGIPYDLSVDGA